ncbi:leukotriene B4 receptor 1-like [Poecilia latipinna]|uniref:leukotriene B4 receptor 1-like n=1 Tax=Poecilia latipinna TaxID=48699 RepID=UPI00072EAC3A|nr:PREDICTED: leukotriene B4 receptor 1-like [Poecilia latipinna]
MDQLNSTVVTSNVSSPIYPPLTTSVLFRLVIFSLCLLVGVPRNIAVIILKPNWNNLSHLTRSLMLNLTVSDLLCLLTIPFWIYTSFFGWTFSPTACKLLVYFQYCTISASLLTVTVLSIQRYFVIVLQRRCHQLLDKVLLVLLWLAAVILSTPALVVHQLNTDMPWTECITYPSEAQQMAIGLTKVLVGFASVSLVVLIYIRLLWKLNQAVFFNNSQTTRLVTCVTVTFFILWLPYHIINVLTVIAVSLKNENLIHVCRDARHFVASVLFINSSINPLLYAFASKKVCSACQKEDSSHQDYRNQTVHVIAISGP